jgi:hypothetical protein
LIVVSDTSPILNLAAVGKLYLLRDLYSEIIIPPAARHELESKGIELDLSWMCVVAARNRTELAKLRARLDPGEAEAIIVATEMNADLLLADERRGRRIAMEYGLEVTGLLGVLAEAKVRGIIDRCQPVLDEMIRVAGFWLSEGLRTRYLQDLGEV